MQNYIILLCTKFQGNQITRLRFMTTFVVRRKEKQIQKIQQEKKWRTSVNFQKHLVRFSWNLKYEVRTLASISTAKISWFRWSVTELHMHENCIIVFPVNNSRCGALASWAAWHTTMCLDNLCITWKKAFQKFKEKGFFDNCW